MCINERGTYWVVFLSTSYSWRFEGALRVEIILDQEPQKLSGWISSKGLFYLEQITGRQAAASTTDDTQDIQSIKDQL